MNFKYQNPNYKYNSYQGKFNKTIELRKNIKSLRNLYLFIADNLNNENIKTLEEAKKIDIFIFRFNKIIRILKKDKFNPEYLTDIEKKQINFLLEKYEDGTLKRAEESIKDTILFLEEIESFSVSDKTKKLCKLELKKRMGNKNRGDERKKIN